MAKKTAYSYIRFSTPEQQKGDSLRRQLSKSEAWCERNGYTLESKTYRDLGVSAFKGNNAAMGKLGAFIEAVDSGAIKTGTVLIVESLDRLTRQEVPDALELFLGILRRGIIIVTLAPEDRFERKTLNEIQLIIAIVILSRAYNESSTKSVRGNANWEQKRANIGEKKLTRRCPAWLKLVGNEFQIIENKAEVVRTIFRMAAEGWGLGRLVKFLNQKKIPSMNGKTWAASSVLKILRSRSVFGEFTPRYGRGGTNVSQRPAAGAPVPNYYTPILTEADFYAAERGLEQRKLKSGPVGKRVTNLFTGKLFSSDGHRMNVTNKGGGPMIVSSGAKRGVAGSAKYMAFSLKAFETAFMSLVSGLKPDDVFPMVNQSDKAKKLQEVRGKLSAVENRLKELNQQIEGDTDLSVILPVVKKMASQKKDLEAVIEALKIEMSNSQTENLSVFKNICHAMNDTTGDDLIDLRTRLRGKIAELIERIDTTILEANNQRLLKATVTFEGGGKENFEVIRLVKYQGGGSSNPVPYTTYSGYRLDDEGNITRFFAVPGPAFSSTK